MKKIMKTLIVISLALALLAGMSSGIAAATAESVWVNGIELTDGDYLASNDSTAITAGATKEPATYVAWYCDGTLMLNDVDISNGYTTRAGYKTGSCGIYANGDIIVVLNGENQVKNDVTELCNGIVAEGDLTVTSNECASLDILTKFFGLYSDTGDIIISGNPIMEITNDGNDMTAKGAIFSFNGSIVIKDYAEIQALLIEGSGDGSSAVVHACDGNISISDYVILSAESHDYTGFGCGLCARDPNEKGNGNITFSGSVNVYAMGVTYGIYLDNDINVGNNSLVSVQGDCGIFGMQSLTVNRGCLEVCGTGGNAFANGKDSWHLNDSYLALAYYNYQIPLTTATEFNKISYQSSRVSNYIYENNTSNTMYYFLFYPEHDCENFIDYSNWDWASPYNCFVIENGIMGSVYSGSDYFDSNGTVTRGMVVAVMYRLCGSPELSQADYDAYNNKFTDVEKGQWYYDPVVWAYNNGVTEGKTSTTFAPSEKTSREQIVTFFWRFCDHLGYDNSGDNVLSSYNDLNKVSSFAVDAFRWSVTYGIINGTSQTELSPKSPCTRGQMAKIIDYFTYIYMDDQDWVDIGRTLLY